MSYPIMCAPEFIMAVNLITRTWSPWGTQAALIDAIGRARFEAMCDEIRHLEALYRKASYAD